MDKTINMDPLVTIIVPAYNHEKYIKYTLDSIINQNYEKIELIVVDDCSRDNTPEIIRSYKDKALSRFVGFLFIQNEKNLGIASSLNKALNQSHGKYISFIASDDIMAKDKISRQIELFNELSSSYAVVCGNCNFIDEHNKQVFYSPDGILNSIKKPNYYQNGTEFILRNNDKEYFLKNFGSYKTLLKKNYINAASTLIKKEALIKLNGFDENFLMEDWPLWIGLSKKYKFFYDEKITFHYRKHHANTFQKGRFNREKTRILLREKNYCYSNKLKKTWQNYYLKNLINLFNNGFKKESFVFALRTKSLLIILYHFALVGKKTSKKWISKKLK